MQPTGTQPGASFFNLNGANELLSRRPRRLPVRRRCRAQSQVPHATIRSSSASLFLAALCLSGIGSGCLQASHEAEKLEAQNKWSRLRADFKTQLANQQLERGKFDDAVETVREAIVLDPENPSYRRFLAKCYLEQGALASAREATAVAARLGDESAELAYVRGMIAERRLRHEEAVEHYWTAAGVEPGNVDYLLAAAESMVSAGLAEEAKEVLDDGLEVLEGNERLLLMRARVCVVLDDLVQAAADYEAVEHLLAESALAVGEYGRVLVALGQYARALAILRPLAELDTQSVNKQSNDERMPAFILRTLAECYIGVGAPEQSRELLEEHLRRSPDDDRAWWLLAESFIRLAEWKEAERCVERGEQVAPGRTDWKLLRAYLAGRDGNSAEAVELLETILAERPEDVVVRCFLARLYEKRGEIGRARAEFELVRNYDPTYPCVGSHFESKEIPEKRSAALNEAENTFDRFDSKGLPCRQLSSFLPHITSVFP